MRSALSPSVRGDLRPWPYDPETMQVVLLDVATHPSPDDIAQWVEAAAQRGARRLRTSALFPRAAERFEAAGFGEIDRLALLHRELADYRSINRTGITSRNITGRNIAGSNIAGGNSTGGNVARPSLTSAGRLSVRRAPMVRPMRRRDHHAVAATDRAAFPAPWALDAASLRDVERATPESRARVVRVRHHTAASDGASRVVGFAISGRANGTGYLQRLAVNPAAQRSGFAAALVDDALCWMRRHAVEALVNTGVDNAPALALYERFGFSRRPDDLVIAELPLR